jgi:hypothetical protein
MTKTLKIGIGLFLLGIIGFFYSSELSVWHSVLWYSIIIVSLIMATIGIILVWIEWGGKRKGE